MRPLRTDKYEINFFLFLSFCMSTTLFSFSFHSSLSPSFIFSFHHHTESGSLGVLALWMHAFLSGLEKLSLVLSPSPTKSYSVNPSQPLWRLRLLLSLFMFISAHACCSPHGSFALLAFSNKIWTFLCLNLYANAKVSLIGIHEPCTV